MRWMKYRNDQGNLECDQTKHTTETQDHKSMNSKMIKLLSKVCELCEEKKHAIMDCLSVPFHIITCISRHVELQNVAQALIDQPQEQESGILVIQNIFRNMELGSQLGPWNQQINSFIQTISRELEGHSHPHMTSQWIPMGNH
jgi:hypothetical protein